MAQSPATIPQSPPAEMPFDGDIVVTASGDIDAADLFPDEYWSDVPALPKGAKETMSQNGQVFDVLAVYARTSDEFSDPLPDGRKEHKPIWVVIMSIDGTEMASVFPAQYTRTGDPVTGLVDYLEYDKCYRMHLVLRRGGAIRNCRIVSVETGRGNAFLKIVPARTRKG